jgi:hypothetical protein
MKDRMSGIFKRLWIFTLAVSLAAWSQAEICPMLMQGLATACARVAGTTQPPASHHDCCPRSLAHMKSHCARVNLAMGDHGMPCWSLDPPPASTPKASPSSQPQVIVAVLHAFCPPAPSQRRASVDPAPSPGNPVFRLKEDLRV